MSKIAQLRSYLASKEASLAVLSDPVTINYLTGFSCDPHERQLFLFVYLDYEPVIFVPSLELEKASRQLPFSVIGYFDAQNPWEVLTKQLPFLGAKRIFAEFDHLNVSKFKGLESVFAGRFENLTPFIQQMRLIKSADEIKTMTIAGDYADKAVNIGFEAISLAKTETDILAEIEFGMKAQGIQKMSFDTMVLTGNNAADPHGEPSKNRIENNALLLFDLGVMYKGYASDMTRTVAVGQPDQFKKDIYELCLEAQLTAQDFVKPGVRACEIDKAARDVIQKAGYAEYFNHRLGHGIGMDVHEYPSIMEGNDLIIEEGMCFSIEPGIYIPGKVGVRIEDCGYVDKDGFKPFTQTPKELRYFEG
ncbi:M24 family metallopeptidase [Streptococcus sp. zg-JUN1979]|uniref:M24 family metallopeptidase n=1 Tax=Streptococcus sp. zg-JUN1979 TaxID=3391450 RepID=UPI0039A5F2ED